MGICCKKMEDDLVFSNTKDIIELNLKSLESDVKSLESDVKSLESDVKSLESDVKSLESDVKSLESDVKSLEPDEVKQSIYKINLLMIPIRYSSIIILPNDTRDSLNAEYKRSMNNNIPYHFEDIIDPEHQKYMDKYSEESTDMKTLFWGIGIENESYLMLDRVNHINDFITLKKLRERYSVDYYKNFKTDKLIQSLQQLHTCTNLTYPIYVNSHTFQKMDMKGAHKTHYDSMGTTNMKFTESIHDVLLKRSLFYREKYDTSIVFDGDSIEFITQDFYNTTVDTCIQELIELKSAFINEIRPLFSRIENGGIVQFPDHNYGLVSFHTTRAANLGLCNNGTYHINLTLPTYLDNGVICDKSAFANQHLNLIRYLQILEPLFVACYGTPDIMSIVSSDYSIGSLRVSLSRYISLQTFDTAAPVNGKLLLMQRSVDERLWYNQLRSGPYELNDKIGYDVNFNKFKNHGIELRFFDWFPEEYMKDVMNLIVLLAAHSVSTVEPCSWVSVNYQNIILKCVRLGFRCQLSSDECAVILRDLQLSIAVSLLPVEPITLLQQISDKLYEQYRLSDVVQMMSPSMARPVLVNYNYIAFTKLYYDIYKE
jgi:hypothetical protein